ncbi:MAG: hypothetical protein ABSB15_11990 [Bryobacteraceae bacterium]|jgi:hypothetical protein
MPYGAGVLETGVIGGVGSMRRDLFAGCHFALSVVLNHWFSREPGRRFFMVLVSLLFCPKET